MAQGLAVFKRDVRRILTTRCLKCHGGKETTSELNLSTRAGLLKGGEEGQVVVPGKPAKSRLLALIAHRSEPKMPQEGTKLSARAVASVAKWIELGAPYDRPLSEKESDPMAWTKTRIAAESKSAWPFTPLKKSTPPASESGWARTDVDRFVERQWKKRGLSPSGRASDRQLLRRMYLGIVGLPPTVEETQAFLADRRPDKVARLADRLLKRPEYGERWARYWLDVARFAESHGFEHDYDRNFAYHYRDFVIRALNQDMPYDRFVRWQLAGDELAPGDPLALMATGFLGAGVFPTQITKNEVERTRYDALDDMAATTGTAMLGLTVGCARCHDHKFDPIPQSDYYRFTSTFTTTVRSEVELNLDAPAYAEAKRKFDAAHAPLAAALAKYEKQVLPGQFKRWEETKGAKPQSLRQWTVLDPEVVKSSGGAVFKKQPDGSFLAGGKNPKFDTYTFTATVRASTLTAVRLEALADRSMVKGGPGRAGNGNFALTDFRLRVQPLKPAKGKSASPQSVKLVRPQATFSQKNLAVANAVDGDKKSGWAVDPQFGKNHAAVFEIDQPVRAIGGFRVTVVMEFKNNGGHNIGRPRLSVATGPGPFALRGEGTPERVLAAIRKQPAERSADDRKALLNWYRRRDDGWRKLHESVRRSLKKAPQPKLTKVMICSEGVKPMRKHSQGADFFDKTHFLRRGDTDQKQGVASQGFLQVLSGGDVQRWRKAPPAGSKLSHRRTALARWMTDAKHGAGHLLARVIVNRLWQHHLGRGIVATPNDFGGQGQLPTHPELLDWLAQKLIDHGWRLKPIHRLIVTSAVYQQDSRVAAANARIDPENVFLWRWSPRRLESEAIRDSMLAVSGRLDKRMYGPGTLDESQRRRSIYFRVKRSKLVPMMQLFDMPEPLASVGSRPTTTIAPQALLFMNNPNVRDFAKGLGDRLNAQSDRFADAVDLGYRICVSRSPTRRESADTVRFLKKQAVSYGGRSGTDGRRPALNDFAQVLLCLNEFIYID